MHRQLTVQAPQGVAGGEVVVEVGPIDAEGNLEPPRAGQVVLSLPSPEALTRQAVDVRRVLEGAGTGIEPLVVVVEAAEQLRDEELAQVLDAARHSLRIILRIICNA